MIECDLIGLQYALKELDLSQKKKAIDCTETPPPTTPPTTRSLCSWKGERGSKVVWNGTQV